MADPQREADGFYHPASVDEIAALISIANQKGLQLRVRGSLHSVSQAIFTDGFSEKDPGRNINVSLDRMTEVAFSADASRVAAQAGCHLYKDPLDETSTPENSLLYQLDQRGKALDDLGGTTHQTISGFLSTGSSGGSLQYSLEDNVRRIQMMDGSGKLHDLTPAQPEFYAAGTSMGLLGVIMQVDFEPTERFCIDGQEAITTIEDCAIDLFGPGAGSRPSLEQFMRETPYSRLMWWPQKDVTKVAVWEARRMVDCPTEFQPYQEMGYGPIDWDSLPDDLKVVLPAKIIGSVIASREAQHAIKAFIMELPADLQELAETLLADVFRGNIDKLKEAEGDLLSDLLQIIVDAYFTFLGNRNAGGIAQKMFNDIFGGEAEFENKWSPLLMNYLFLVADKDKAGPTRGRPQPFWDVGYQGLPMDYRISDQLMPTVFTELWIPIEKTQAVMNALKTFYEGDGGSYERTGTYACEIYGTKKSPFWMSPAYGQDVVRIDIFWFGRNAEAPDQKFYPQFWNLLKGFDFRPHWGKYLPPGDGPQGVAYLRKNYPRWDDFMKLRAQYDPRQIFVTDYWRSHLGIPRLG